MSNNRNPSRNQQVGDFVLNNDAVFAWTCYPYVPQAETAGKKKMRFGVEFKHVEPERRMEILEEFRARMRQREAIEAKPHEDLTDDEMAVLREVLSFEKLLLEEVVVRFTKYIRDKDGNDISEHPETRANMLNNSWARDSLLVNYQQALSSRSPEGN